METETVVSTVGLTKHFKHVQALTDVSVDIMSSEVVGLLGPNGSGKSTLVRLLMGFLKPTSGSARVMKLDCATDSTRVHRHAAYLPGDARLFRTMRGRNVLEFFASIRGSDYLKNATAIARRLDLDLSRWVAFMSTGMRQKLALSVVMAIKVPLIILDEPTSNLDPSTRNEVLSLVSESQSDGKTVLFSSHVLSEVEQVCGRVLVLRAGTLVHEQVISAADDLNKQHQIRILSRSRTLDLPDSLSERALITRSPRADNSDQQEFLLTVDGDMNRILAWLSQQSFDNIRIQPVDLKAIYERFHKTEL